MVLTAKIDGWGILTAIESTRIQIEGFQSSIGYIKSHNSSRV